MAAPLIRAKVLCWIYTLPSIPCKIHIQEELSSQYSSLSDTAQRNEASEEHIEPRCSLLPSESPNGFQTLYLSLYTLLTIWKFIKGF